MMRQKGRGKHKRVTACSTGCVCVKLALRERREGQSSNLYDTAGRLRIGDLLSLLFSSFFPSLGFLLFFSLSLALLHFFFPSHASQVCSAHAQSSNSSLRLTLFCSTSNGMVQYLLHLRVGERDAQKKKTRTPSGIGCAPGDNTEHLQ